MSFRGPFPKSIVANQSQAAVSNLVVWQLAALQPTKLFSWLATMLLETNPRLGGCLGLGNVVIKTRGQ